MGTETSRKFGSINLCPPPFGDDNLKEAKTVLTWYIYILYDEGAIATYSTSYLEFFSHCFDTKGDLE